MQDTCHILTQVRDRGHRGPPDVHVSTSRSPAVSLPAFAAKIAKSGVHQQMYILVN
jgi:hypothetical protein